MRVMRLVVALALALGLQWFAAPAGAECGPTGTSDCDTLCRQLDRKLDRLGLFECTM